MKNSDYGVPQLFEAFVKSVQYVVRLKTQQDIWDHLGKFIMAYFPADWTAFIQRNQSKELSVLYSTLDPETIAGSIFTDDIKSRISDVLESGFLSTHIVFTTFPSMTVFLPVFEGQRSDNVLLIGHGIDTPVPRDLLNIYLAIANLAGTTFERLQNERELNVHRAHLEELVKDRTTELEKAKRQNELILNSAGEGICGVDPDGIITFVNPTATRILGWNPDELIGRNAHATFHHTGKDSCDYPIDKCPVYISLRSGLSGRSRDEEFVHRDGSRFPVEFLTTPIVEGGSTVGAVIIFRDITEQKKAAEELQHRTTQLEYANKELEAYSYSVSHDLRGPLRTISSFTEFLKEGYEPILDETGKDYMRRIIQATDKMSRLIDDLLRLSQISRHEMHTADVDLSNIVKDVLSELQSGSPDRDAQFSIVDSVHVQADTGLLRIAIENLLENAWKYSGKNEHTEIEFGITEFQGKNVFFIRDNGVGFIQGQSDKMFKPFHRLHKDSEFPGTGIGLAIVKRIIEKHEGTIWAEGETGKGATFYFVLP